MKSKFLNVSPRAYIRQKDSVNTLPPIVRTGYQNQTGDYSTPFNDSKSTVVFKNSQVLLAPYMTSLGDAATSGFYLGNLLVTASLKDSNSYFEKAIENPDILPFKEDNNPVAYQLPAEVEGFPADEYLGFSSSDRDKAAISFDISTNSDFDIIKLNRGNSLTGSGPFYGSRGSGFVYYNHKNKSWEDIGIRDPETGQSIDYDPILKLEHQRLAATTREAVISSGHKEFVCQFASSPYSIVSEGNQYVPKSTERLKARGYHTIGEPTSFFEAPYAPRYHATTGSAIKLSSYINQPFAVDRISVSLPIRAIRTQTPQPPYAAPTLPDFGFGRDIDNYVFFLYLQNRSNSRPDSKQDVSSSLRYLIAKESFCFFNAPTLDRVSVGLNPIHSFAKSFAFLMPQGIASASNAPVTQSIEATLNMSFRPQNFNSVFGTTSKLAGRDADIAYSGLITGSVFVQHFWRGGQIASGSSRTIGLYNTNPTLVRSLNVMSGAIPPLATDLVCQPSPRALVSSFWKGSGESIVTGSGFGESDINIPTTSVLSPSFQTPIVLFPDDELVFGIDSGANPNLQSPNRQKSGTDNTILDVTGSRVTIRSGNAKVILYGSLITDKTQYLPVLNQHLGSEAVHESIQEVGPFDQFDILDKKILSSSYVDNIISGKLSTSSDTRNIKGRGTRFQTGITGSLQRNIRMQFSDQLYYDTFLPASSVIVKGMSNASVGATVLTKQPAIVIQKDVTNGYPFEDNRASNSMLNRPFVFERESSEARSRDVKVQLLTAVGASDGVVSGDSARFLLYYNGDISTVSVLPSAISKKFTGAASVRYGMMNVRLIGPSCVFRRDRFGQNRDMLEQARDGIIVTTQAGKDTIGPAVVTAKFVKQLTNTEVDPDQTQCSNLSLFCTSSIPFIDDGVVHNRGSLPSSTVAFGPNNLIFGITGSFGLQ